MGRPTPPWGWHRLERSAAEQLVGRAGVGRHDLVVDVGAGEGALVGPLLDVGARVVAVEAHPGRAEALRRRFGNRITVVRADAADLRLPRRPFHVVANPPFAVTTRLLRRLLQPGGALLSAHLLLERAAAERWASHRVPGVARWASTFEVGLGPSVPRRAFRPPSPVAVSTLVIRRRGPAHAGRGRSRSARR